LKGDKIKVTIVQTVFQVHSCNIDGSNERILTSKLEFNSKKFYRQRGREG